MSVNDNHLSVHAIGSLYWKPAEPGTQQAVGCCCGLPSCICTHADEAVSGKSVPLTRWVQHGLEPPTSLT